MGLRCFCVSASRFNPIHDPGGGLGFPEMHQRTISKTFLIFLLQISRVMREDVAERRIPIALEGPRCRSNDARLRDCPLTSEPRDQFTSCSPVTIICTKNSASSNGMIICPLITHFVNSLKVWQCSWTGLGERTPFPIL